MKTKYKEIHKLKKMLEDADIPFDWIEGWGYGEKESKRLREIAPDLMKRYQICYPEGSFKKDTERWISVDRRFWYLWSRKRPIRNYGRINSYGGI